MIHNNSFFKLYVTVVQLKTEDRTRFFDALTTLLS